MAATDPVLPDNESENKPRPTREFFRRLGERWESFKTNYPQLYIPLLGFFLLGGITIHHYYEKWLDFVQWGQVGGQLGGWVVNLVFFSLCVAFPAVVLVAEYRRHKRYNLPFPWRVWLVVLLLVFFLFDDRLFKQSPPPPPIQKNNGPIVVKEQIPPFPIPQAAVAVDPTIASQLPIADKVSPIVEDDSNAEAVVAAIVQKKEFDRLSSITNEWNIFNDYKKYYDYAIFALGQRLELEAEKVGDDAISVYPSLPDKIGHEVGELPVAKIYFNHNTNRVYQVSISGLDTFSRRYLVVKFSNGAVALKPNLPTYLDAYIDADGMDEIGIYPKKIEDYQATINQAFQLMLYWEKHQKTPKNP